MPTVELKVQVWGLMICDFLGAFAVEVVSTFLFYGSACTSATDRLLKWESRISLIWNANESFEMQIEGLTRLKCELVSHSFEMSHLKSACVIWNQNESLEMRIECLSHLKWESSLTAEGSWERPRARGRSFRVSNIFLAWEGSACAEVKRLCGCRVCSLHWRSLFSGTHDREH